MGGRCRVRVRVRALQYAWWGPCVGLGLGLGRSSMPGGGLVGVTCSSEVQVSTGPDTLTLTLIGFDRGKPATTWDVVRVEQCLLLKGLPLLGLQHLPSWPPCHPIAQMAASLAPSMLLG